MATGQSTYSVPLAGGAARTVTIRITDAGAYTAGFDRTPDRAPYAAWFNQGSNAATATAAFVEAAQEASAGMNAAEHDAFMERLRASVAADTGVLAEHLETNWAAVSARITPAAPAPVTASARYDQLVDIDAAGAADTVGTITIPQLRASVISYRDTGQLPAGASAELKEATALYFTRFQTQSLTVDGAAPPAIAGGDALSGAALTSNAAYAAVMAGRPVPGTAAAAAAPASPTPRERVLLPEVPEIGDAQRALYFARLGGRSEINLGAYGPQVGGSHTGIDGRLGDRTRAAVGAVLDKTPTEVRGMAPNAIRDAVDERINTNADFRSQVLTGLRAGVASDPANVRAFLNDHRPAGSPEIAATLAGADLTAAIATWEDTLPAIAPAAPAPGAALTVQQEYDRLIGVIDTADATRDRAGVEARMVELAARYRTGAADPSTMAMPALSPDEQRALALHLHLHPTAGETNAANAGQTLAVAEPLLDPIEANITAAVARGARAPEPRPAFTNFAAGGIDDVGISERDRAWINDPGRRTTDRAINLGSEGQIYVLAHNDGAWHSYEVSSYLARAQNPDAAMSELGLDQLPVFRDNYMDDNLQNIWLYADRNGQTTRNADGSSSIIVSGTTDYGFRGDATYNIRITHNADGSYDYGIVSNAERDANPHFTTTRSIPDFGDDTADFMDDGKATFTRPAPPEPAPSAPVDPAGAAVAPRPT